METWDLVESHRPMPERGMEKSAESADHSALSQDFQKVHLELREILGKVLLKRVGDRHLAQDLVQETFLRYWKSLRGGGVIRQPERWLIRVAINLAEDWRRSFFSRQVHVGLTPGTLEGLECSRPSRDETMNQLKRDLVRHLPLTELRERDRLLLILRLSLGFQPNTIGDLMGIGTDATRMRLFRAYRRMRGQPLRV
jgi:RNA polymerase sigma-70 factor (ECF subfamily)